MKQQQHLIGFYRKNGLMTPIYHHQKTFYDLNLYRHYKAIIVPLSTYTNPNKWILSSYAQHLDPTTRSFLDKHIVWITSPKKTSVFYALMYTDIKVPSMTRTGYLMIRDNHDYHPVNVSINNHDYLIEIKGVGSPLGAFPATHLRNQAGCFEKTHVRITGGLFEQEGHDEFHTLLKKDTLFKEHDVCSEVKPLGITTFCYLDFNFSVLLRLVPSSLRASFSKHPFFDSLMKHREKHAYFHMGSRMSTLLKHSPPLHHQNLSLNNMVYVHKNTYDLTDWSETNSLFTSYSALDYIKCLYPIVYFNKLIPLKELQYFLRGASSTPSSPLHTEKPFRLRSFKQAATIHERLFKPYGLAFYRYRLKHGIHHSGIQLNLQFLKHYFPTEYFKSSTQTWLNSHLLPSLESRIDVLNYLLATRRSLSRPNAQALMKFQHNAITESYLNHVYRIYPPLKPTKKEKPKSLNDLLVGEFISDTPLMQTYFESLSLISEHKKRINQLESLTHELQHCPPRSFSLKNFLNFTCIPTSYSSTYILFPYCFLIASVIYSECIFLRHATEDPLATSTEKKHILLILSYYQGILDQLETNPEVYKSVFCQSETEFIKLFTWPTK